MDGDDRVVFALHQATDGIGHPFLHLGVGALYRVQFDTRVELPRVGRGDRRATHTDAVVVAAQQHDLVAGARLTLEGLGFLAAADTAG